MSANLSPREEAWWIYRAALDDAKRGLLAAEAAAFRAYQDAVAAAEQKRDEALRKIAEGEKP